MKEWFYCMTLTLCFGEKKMFCDYRLVVGQIDELLIYCKYGIRKENGIYVVDPTGCQEQIAIGNYMLFFFFQNNFSRYRYISYFSCESCIIMMYIAILCL